MRQTEGATRRFLYETFLLTTDVEEVVDLYPFGDDREWVLESLHDYLLRYAVQQDCGDEAWAFYWLRHIIWEDMSDDQRRALWERLWGGGFEGLIVYLKPATPRNQIQDIHQDVAERAWRKFDQYDARLGMFSTWISTIIHTVVSNRRRAATCEKRRPIGGTISLDAIPQRVSASRAVAIYI